jgi:hypothetical protein
LIFCKGFLKESSTPREDTRLAFFRGISDRPNERQTYISVAKLLSKLGSIGKLRYQHGDVGQTPSDKGSYHQCPCEIEYCNIAVWMVVLMPNVSNDCHASSWIFSSTVLFCLSIPSFYSEWQGFPVTTTVPGHNFLI